jgi:PAS domain S-box-containing protein
MNKDPDGVILYANEAMFQATGYLFNDLIGRTPGEIWGNQRDESFYEEMWHAIKVEKRTFAANVLNRKKDGTYYNCDLRIYPVLGEDNDINFFVGITFNFEYAI